MTAESLARALGGRKVGSQWMAKCPAHDDHNPSLSITYKHGTVLVHCHAGCDQRDVIEAFNAKGLWAERPAKPRRKIIATYDYTDEAGHLLYQVLRTEPKGFFQRRPDGEGGWTNKKSKRQVLYRLPEVLEAPIVFVVEGEKDVETLREYGFVATTNAGGADAPWLPSFTQTLAGREVILIPDNDRAGWLRIKRIACELRGHAAPLRLLPLPGEHKDISEWFEAGHGELELIAMLEEAPVNAGS
jgi:putative DNA primase/helicase